MNSDDAYQAWLEQRRSVAVPDEFARGVMNRISLPDRQSWVAPANLERLQRWLEWVAHRPLVKATLLVVALIAGAARLLVMWQIVFSF